MVCHIHISSSRLQMPLPFSKVTFGTDTPAALLLDIQGCLVVLAIDSTLVLRY